MFHCSTLRHKFIACITIFTFVSVSTGVVFAQATSDAKQMSQAAPVSQTTSTSAMSGSGSVAQAQSDAEMDAKADVHGGTWFIVGCLLGVVGWIVAYVIEPNPPATRLLGKSAEYVAVYSDAYKREGKKVQSQKALVGCLVGTAVTAIVEVIVLVSAASAASTTAQSTY